MTPYYNQGGIMPALALLSSVNLSHALPMNSSPYGGSVTTASTEASGSSRKTSRQSPFRMVGQHHYAKTKEKRT